MTELGGWIKQMILIIFLAVLADFLLPTQAMQKYVRVVMGLAIIAVMIQPIIPIVGRNWASQVANQAIVEIFGSPSTAAGLPQQRFDAYTNELAAEQVAETLKLAEERLKWQIEASCKCPVEAVQMTGLSANTVQSVTVITSSATDRKVRPQIVTFVASQLGIGTNQVRVESPPQGGASHGF